MLIQPVLRPVLQPVLRSIFDPGIGGGGGTPSLTAQVQALFAKYSAAGGMWDFTDMATLWQDSAGTTPVTAASQPVGRAVDISGNGLNFLQATAGKRGLYETTGVDLDGVDDLLQTSAFAAGTLTSNMDCSMVVRRDVAKALVLAFAEQSGVANWFGVADPGSASYVNHAAVGSPSIYINNVLLSSPTRMSLSAALGTGAWVVVEVRNLKLSAWTLFSIGTYGTGLSFSGAYRRMITSNLQTTDQRNLIRQWLMEGVV